MKKNRNMQRMVFLRAEGSFRGSLNVRDDVRDSFSSEGDVTVEDEEYRQKKRKVGCSFQVVFHRRATFESTRMHVRSIEDISISRALSPRLSKTLTRLVLQHDTCT